MTEKYILNEHIIPDGIMHDQELNNISFDGDTLILSFDIHYYPKNYTDTALVEKYKDFKICRVKCKINDDFFSEVLISTSPDKKRIYQVKEMPIEEFIGLANKEIKKRKEKGYFAWSYNNIVLSPNTNLVTIELSIWLKLKRKIYTTCQIILDTNEIKYIWE